MPFELPKGYTPGPWRVYTTTDGTKVIGIGDAEGGGVADCGFGVWRGGEPEARSNAALIAIAPEMASEIRRLEAENASLTAALREVEELLGERKDGWVGPALEKTRSIVREALKGD